MENEGLSPATQPLSGVSGGMNSSMGSGMNSSMGSGMNSMGSVKGGMNTMELHY